MKASRHSIQKSLVRNLSVSICAFLFAILLATDRGVDNWVSNEFDRAMLSKAALLITLVDQDAEGIEFDFADEFMPEFSSSNSLEYFRLWLAGEPFESSKSLIPYDSDSLSYQQDIALHTHKFSNIILPDQRNGRMVTMPFIAQIDSDSHRLANANREQMLNQQKPMQLSYAVSTEELDEILLFIDIIFLLSVFITGAFVNIAVRLVISKGLAPLADLNAQLDDIKSHSLNAKISLTDSPKELNTIVASINEFIAERFKLFDKQKRVTSDIAHELKTPISELITLSEVSLTYPNEKTLAASYKTEVLAISQRMKKIVNDIMLLQLSSASNELSKEKVDLSALIKSILIREQLSKERLMISSFTKPVVIQSNKFALQTIMNNLINNAVFYSPDNSVIHLVIHQDVNSASPTITISNQSTQTLKEQDLKQIFDPLWQKDASRTAVDRFGLGLSIVKSFCDALNIRISIEIGKGDTFSLTLHL